MNRNADPAPNGLPYAVVAYLMWGLLPLYFRLLHAVPPFPFLAWRTIWTVPVCVVAIIAARQGPALVTALTNRRTLCALALSSLMIGGNWLIYIIAIQQGHVLAASLGYYINPLMNIVMGTLFLGERLRRAQWAAVALAGAGVAVLAFQALDTLAISLGLAFTFAFYGLVRKLVAVGPLPGLTVEVMVLLLPATALLWLAPDGGHHFGANPGQSALLALTGLITAIPLMLFAHAARHMPYSTLGFVQFLAPTIVFVTSLTLFGEALKPAQAISFALIWAAIGVYCRDLWVRRSG
ncbi:EamA family transporter RarD [Novosphingobium sp. FSY-8]|uniref:EamA family transporter RarD n=1 Tax=Novosphingobium ovatum TaxID=1908523 RepID=A0ABW9XBF0_9SPHN|nr:EamA family transporter RarD [Novosphingobium ovatum]NBC35837.1 EamA family transporter RarD [Novosphingobium ovatum]